MSKLKCPQCSTWLTVAAAARPQCPNCGYEGPETVPPAPVPLVAPLEEPPRTRPREAAPKDEDARGPALVTKQVAWIATALNALPVTGIGSLVLARRRLGVLQLIASSVGLLVALASMGVWILLPAWAWGLLTGAQAVRQANVLEAWDRGAPASAAD